MNDADLGVTEHSLCLLRKTGTELETLALGISEFSRARDLTLRVNLGDMQHARGRAPTWAK